MTRPEKGTLEGRSSASSIDTAGKAYLNVSPHIGEEEIERVSMQPAFYPHHIDWAKRSRRSNARVRRMLQSGWFEMISFEDLLLEHTFEEGVSGSTRLCILGLGNPNFPMLSHTCQTCEGPCISVLTLPLGLSIQLKFLTIAHVPVLSLSNPNNLDASPEST